MVLEHMDPFDHVCGISQDAWLEGLRAGQFPISVDGHSLVFSHEIPVVHETMPHLPDEEKPPAPPPTSATSQLDEITAQLRELKAKAILEPTPANVTAYIRFQREQLDRASLFSDVWQRAIWQDPELD